MADNFYGSQAGDQLIAQSQAGHNDSVYNQIFPTPSNQSGKMLRGGVSEYDTRTEQPVPDVQRPARTYKGQVDSDADKGSLFSAIANSPMPEQQTNKPMQGRVTESAPQTYVNVPQVQEAQIQYRAPEVRDTDVLRITAKNTRLPVYPGYHEVYILNSAAHDASNLIMIYDGYGRPINPVHKSQVGGWTTVDFNTQMTNGKYHPTDPSIYLELKSHGL